MYGKAFRSMYTGSMVGAGAHVFAVWGYVIANCSRDGHVELNPILVSAVIGCTADDVNNAVEVLTRADPDSRNKEHEGKRLVQEAAFLYFAPSYAIYREIRDDDDRKAYMREYMKQYRARKHAVNSVSVGKPQLAHADADADAEVDIEAKDQKLEHAAQPKRATRIPADSPTEADLEWAREKRPEVNAEAERDKFRDFWTAKAGKDAAKLDWRATWRNWIRNAQAVPRRGNGHAPPMGKTATAYFQIQEAIRASEQSATVVHPDRGNGAKQLDSPRTTGPTRFGTASRSDPDVER